MKKLCLMMLFCVMLLLGSCKKPVHYGDLTIIVEHTVDGNPLILDSLAYTNEAGNRYLVNEVQWFISNIMLRDEEGNTYTMGHRLVDTPIPASQDHIFYIDTNMPETLTLRTSPIPSARYTSISFTFGLNRDDNVTGLFPDPPERDMFWPEQLGGGYHYMKLNGKYLDGDDHLVPMNIHLGIGQNEDQTVFYQNYFTMEFPLNFLLEYGDSNTILLMMDIGNWFSNPHVYDFNTYGSAIMQNQEAQQLLRENGMDVFSVKTPY